MKNNQRLFTAAGLLKISGIDATKLLQGQLTCNVEKASSTQAILGAHCNPQGRIVSLFYLWTVDNAYYLLMQRSMIPIAYAALKKYAIFYKLDMADVSDDITIAGHASKSPTAIALPAPATRSITMHETIDSLSDEEWASLTIEETIPTIYPETSGKFLPHELNLHTLSAIDFDKGCYTGQEIIARMHYRGKLKKCMYHAILHSKNRIAPGADIYKNANIIGNVVSLYKKAEHHYAALIVMETSSLTDIHFYWDANASLPCEIVINNEKTND